MSATQMKINLSGNTAQIVDKKKLSCYNVICH